jgi:DegV family protein with EDD domain
VPADAKGPRTAVVTDTTAYLPEDLVTAHDIKRVSLYVSLDGVQQPEIEIAGDDYRDFFDRLRSSREGATTSQPSVGDFCAVYEPLLAEGRDIVSIHLSAGISGTCESAIQARERLTSEGKDGERIRIYDSRSSCGGQALVTLAAAAAAAAGGDGADALAAAERCRDALQMWFAIDTLEYLRKGGRIGAAQAWLGSALQIKPILTLGEEITPVERVRTRRRAFERLVDYARQRRDDGADAWIVQHIQDNQAAQRMADQCRELFGSDPVFVSEIGPVIGAHTGPGLLGVGGAPSGLLHPSTTSPSSAPGHRTVRLRAMRGRWTARPGRGGALGWGRLSPPPPEPQRSGPPSRVALPPDAGAANSPAPPPGPLRPSGWRGGRPGCPGARRR